MDYRNRRIDEILLMMDELMQSIAIEGDLLAEAADNDAEEKAEAANKAEKYDHPQLAGLGSAKGNSLRDIIDDDVKRMRVVRWIELAAKELADKLYPYTKSIDRHPQYNPLHRNVAHGDLLTNQYREPEFWQINLCVPATFASTTTSYIQTLGQEYVVGRVIAEWCSLYYKEKEDWARLRVVDIENKISAAKDRRMMPVRRRGSVY